MVGSSEGMTVLSDSKSGNMISEPVLEEGVFRFDCSADDRNKAFPSLSFADPKVRDTPTMSSHKTPSYTPTSECVFEQQFVQVEFPTGTSFYGTGEVSGQLERNGKRVFTWNTNAWSYRTGTTSLYQSHPWVLAVLPSGEAVGVLPDTTKRCEIDLRKESTIKFISPLPYPVITFALFASPADVLVSLSHATGIFHQGLLSCRQSDHWGIINAVRAIFLLSEFARLCFVFKSFLYKCPENTAYSGPSGSRKSLLLSKRQKSCMRRHD